MIIIIIDDIIAIEKYILFLVSRVKTIIIIIFDKS